MYRGIPVHTLLKWLDTGIEPETNRKQLMGVQTCGERRCCNPDHLAVVTRESYARRVMRASDPELAARANWTEARTTGPDEVWGEDD